MGTAADSTVRTCPSNRINSNSASGRVLFSSWHCRNLSFPRERNDGLNKIPDLASDQSIDRFSPEQLQGARIDEGEALVDEYGNVVRNDLDHLPVAFLAFPQCPLGPVLARDRSEQAPDQGQQHGDDARRPPEDGLVLLVKRHRLVHDDTAGRKRRRSDSEPLQLNLVEHGAGGGAGLDRNRRGIFAREHPQRQRCGAAARAPRRRAACPRRCRVRGGFRASRRPAPRACAVSARVLCAGASDLPMRSVAKLRIRASAAGRQLGDLPRHFLVAGGVVEIDLNAIPESRQRGLHLTADRQAAGGVVVDRQHPARAGVQPERQSERARDGPGPRQSR